MSKKIRLPKLFRTKWLTALESGRYKQVKSNLYDGEGYCCLGVAGRCLNIKRTDLDGLGMPSDLEDVDIKLARKFPKAIVEFKVSEVTNESEPKSTAFANTLANMNDDEDKNFKEIAAYIRKNTVGV